MRTLSIGELAQQVGIQSSAVRYYEEIGLMPAPHRTGGWRRYDFTLAHRLEVIHSARELGFSVEEIRTLLDGFAPATAPSDRWRTLAEEKLPEIDKIIAHATALKHILEAGLTCDCEDIELCLSTKGESCAEPRPNTNIALLP